jgi:hypothetical protein
MHAADYPEVPDVAQVALNILFNSAPSNRREVCRYCNGIGQVPTIGFRGPGPASECWDCGGSGSEVAA